MTPLEELQAAHKRLSELRRASAALDPPPWVVELESHGSANVTTNNGSGDICYNQEGGIFDPETADLIVTLHRTIDAQLTLLSDRGLDQTFEDTRTPDPAVLTLARAINGGTK